MQLGTGFSQFGGELPLEHSHRPCLSALLAWSIHKLVTFGFFLLPVSLQFLSVAGFPHLWTTVKFQYFACGSQQTCQMLLWPQKEHLAWCPGKSRPRWFRNPPAALRRGIQLWSLLILQVLLKVHQAQVTSQWALSVSDLPVTAESQESVPADGAVKYRLHWGSDFFTGSNEKQLRAGLQPSDPGVSGAVELSCLCPWLAWSSGQVTWLTRPSLSGDHMQRSPTTEADPPVRWDGRSPRGTSVTDRNGSFLHCEAWEGWNDTAQTHCDTPWLLTPGGTASEQKRRTFPWTKRKRTLTLIIIFHQPINFNVSY